jgi:multimeric flavodoxin WrbA
MKKITAVIGSPNDAKSNTATMTRDFLETVKRFNPDVEYEVISLGTRRIEYCRGCWACMLKGACVHHHDALHEIMEEIQACDLLIMGSPVYEMQVSAQIKAFFDRTWMWIHCLGLLGKPALTAVTTGGDSPWLTEKYLSLTLTLMGCIMTGHLRGVGKQPGVFPDRERCRTKYVALARKVADILGGKRKINPRLMNRIGFSIMKHHTRRIITGKDIDQKYQAFERDHWEKKGWFNLSFKKALQKEKALPEQEKAALYDSAARRKERRR